MTKMLSYSVYIDSSDFGKILQGSDLSKGQLKRLDLRKAIMKAPRNTSLELYRDGATISTEKTAEIA